MCVLSIPFVSFAYGRKDSSDKGLRPQQPVWQISPSPREDVEEGEVGGMGTPPGDVVVEGEEAVEAGPSASAPPEDLYEGEVEEVGDMCTPPGECLTPQLIVIYVCLHISKDIFFPQF
ncbi:hypothetical protein AB205_0019930 [Aquarana catesbeiana]|uniref:Uncharacterized protein n=1 Tax=Aquarana catesbeiana TaxID=8400 RepID=A0A2G9RY77_AQUCT|nr:hypothetical protein AB205_0019930 [Aquarana catesbeiana]